MTDALHELSDDDLRALAGALRRQELRPPFDDPVAVSRYCPGRMAETVAGALATAAADGMHPRHLALVLETLLGTRARRPLAESVIDLVWSGPDVGDRAHRETAAVVRSLFTSATRSVLVATYVIHNGRDLFQPLADRMATLSNLRVELFVDLRGLPPAEFARRFTADHWPADRPLPVVYFDTRTGPGDPEQRASFHSKFVAADTERLFLTSANVTAWAQNRNIEAGLVVSSRPLCVQVEQHLRSLVEQTLLERLPLPT
jgi:phosphatidylserine/phosphatidylglycerophosphate/cardiolipin synthase-like enzyme